MSEDKLEKLRNDLANLAYEIKRDFLHKGRRLVIAAVAHPGCVVASGVSQETWDSNKSGIREIVADALKQRELNTRRKEHEWIVDGLRRASLRCVAAGEDGRLYKLSNRVPREIWNKIAHLFYRVENDDEIEGLCDYGGYARGWVTEADKEVDDILKDEAEKVATQEDRDEVTRLDAEHEEYLRDEERKERECKEAVEEARQLAQRFTPCQPDWSWDDYRFRVGDKVHETKHWAVHKYMFADNPFDHGENFSKETQDGYVLKQKYESEQDIGTVGYAEFISSQN
jgi:hypothetical protein